MEISHSFPAQVDAARKEDQYAAYSTGSATGTFETTPGMGAKFCAAAWDSRRTFVVAPSTVLNCVEINHWFGTSRPNFEIL